MGVKMNQTNDPVLQEIHKQILALQDKAYEHLAVQLPAYPVKLKGYAHGTKEVLAEVEGDFRLDQLVAHVQDKNLAVRSLLIDHDRVEANKILPKLGRVFFVIDCGVKPVEAPATPSPTTPSDPAPEPIYA